MYQTVCLNCNVPFTKGRSDQMFCSDKCGSAYWKAHGTTHSHKDLPHFNSKDCEQCGNQFWYNDYAERKGKRIPRFCSTRCRVRYWRHERDGIPFDRPYTTQDTKKEAPHARPFKTGDFRDSLRIPTRWTAKDAFDWLGLPYDASKSQCQAAMRSLNKAYHPDMNGNNVWPHLVHVNAAYDYLKRNYFD
jgi:hypothetical protein